MNTECMGQFSIADPYAQGVIGKRQAELESMDTGSQVATSEDVPFYKRPVESIVGWLGNTTVDTGNIAVQTQDGTLRIMPSDQLYAMQKQQAGGDFGSFFKSIPMPVWIGIGGIGLLLILRK